MKAAIVCIIGLAGSWGHAAAEPLVEGRVRLDSGQPVPGAQVLLFDLSDLRAAPLAATTDRSGHFTLPLATLAGPLPERFELGANYPNPFNPSTMIPYQLPAPMHVRLEVFNILGQRIATLVDGERSAGFHTTSWDATDAAGEAVGAGVYLYRLSADGVQATRSMLLIDGQAGIPSGGGGSTGSGGEAGAGKDGETAPVYGLAVSGPGLVPYVDPAFRMEAGMAPLDLVVEAPGSVPPAKVASGGILGDVDNTGGVDFFDALLVALYSRDSSIVMPNHGDITLGDVNADGQIDLADAWLIAAYLNDSSDPALPSGIGEPVAAATASLSPDPSTMTFADDGAWHRFTVEAGEPVSVVANPGADSPRLEITTRSGRGNYCPAEADDDVARGDGQTLYLAGCSTGPATVELRRESDGTVLRTYTFEVTGSPADLVVESVSVSDSTLTPGQSFTLSATVRNQGTGGADATTLRYYRSTNRTISTRDTRVGTDGVSALGASRTSAESISLTAPSSAGTYYYGACVVNVAGESAGNNCSAGVRVRIEAGSPDLIVESVSVSNSNLTTGESFTLNATVRNQGTGAAAATALRYYRSSNATITSSDTEVGTDAVGALDASATSAASIALTAPTSVSAEEGIYYGACVDSVRGESNTDNNCSSAVKITVSGQVATVTLPPPTWVFAGDVPADDQTVLREEMEYSRAYFSDRFGVEATGFTVLVGSDYETLSPVYREVIGRDLSDSYPTIGVTTDAWVTVSRTGGAVVTLIYGRSQEALATLEHYIVHEYFHVLQGQLASGFAKLQGGEVAFYNDTIDHGPLWLMEGLASYADYAYTPGRPGRRPFLNDRYYPYLNISDYQREWGAISLKELSSGEEDYRHLGCSFGDSYVYAMGFAASVYLLEQAEEDSYVNYWSSFGKRPTWQQAFEEAFGIGANDFYKAFDEWLPSQLPPPRVTLDLQVRWPGTGNQLRPGSFLYAITEEAHPWKIPPRSASTGWFGQGTLPTMIFEYEEGAVGTAYLSLWWYHINDLCTEYLLGWYKDGELTDRREHATAVEFTGRSSTLDWSLPGDPDTLPRLEERKVVWCE